MSVQGPHYERIDHSLKRRGLMARGGIQIDTARLQEPGNGLPDECTFKTVILAGHAGSSFWSQFRQFKSTHAGDDPLDAWSRSVAAPIAKEFGCTAIYPFEKPWWPFQRWIMVSEGLKASPLGILIHPKFGLWHGYRAAFGFDHHIEIPPGKLLEHACDTCITKPCLSACPANALVNETFDLKACRTYLSAPTDSTNCMDDGCIARNACPVGEKYRYTTEHLQFHMRALALPNPV